MRGTGTASGHPGLRRLRKLRIPSPKRSRGGRPGRVGWDEWCPSQRKEGKTSDRWVLAFEEEDKAAKVLFIHIVPWFGSPVETFSMFSCPFNGF